MPKLKYDLATVLSLVEGPGSDALSRWLHAGEGTIAAFTDAQAASLIEAATRLKRPDRVAAAQAEAGNKAVRKAAAAAAHKLRSAGVELPTVTAQATWSLGQETVELPPPVTLIGMPDPHAWLPFVVVSFSRSETVAFAGLAGAAFGHRDTHHSHLPRSEARKLIHDARRGHELHELPPHVALHLLGRAFSEGGATPHEWEHFSDLVGAGVMTSAQVLDPFRSRPQEIDADVLADVAPLLDDRQQLVVGLSEEQGSRAVAEIMGALQSKLEVDDDSRKRRLKRVLDEVADEALDERSRKAWAFALDVVALVAADRGEEAVSNAAWHTSLALKEGRAGRDIPFIRANVERQLATITEIYTKALAERAAPSDAGPELG